MFQKFSVFLKFLRFTESLEVKIKIRLAMIRYFFLPHTERKNVVSKCKSNKDLRPQTLN